MAYPLPLGRSSRRRCQRHSRPKALTLAIFYSISNCQPGLRGISFGNFLIKQVADELKSDYPALKQFSTLSPVPGFRRWLDGLDTSVLERALGSDIGTMIEAMGTDDLAIARGCLVEVADEHAIEPTVLRLLQRLCAYLVRYIPISENVRPLEVGCLSIGRVAERRIARAFIEFTQKYFKERSHIGAHGITRRGVSCRLTFS